MKFTPKIDKNVVLYDTSKKLHVSFNDVESSPVTETKKRSHPAHESSEKAVKKKHKSDKKKKDSDATKNEGELVAKKPITPTPVAQPRSKPVPIKAATTPIATPLAVKSNASTAPKKAKKKAKVKQAPKKLTQEEILAKVAAIRKKKQLKRQAKVKVDGQVIVKPTFNIIPNNLKNVMPTKQLGEFVLYALSETSNLPWCSIIHKTKVDHVVMMYAQGLSCSYFGVNDTTTPYIDLEGLEESVGKAAMPFLTKQAKYMITNQVSGKQGRFNSPVADILQCNMSNSKKERLAKEKQAKMAKYKGNMREFYMLSLEEMRKNDYPIPPLLDQTVVLPDGWKQTHPALEPLKEGERKRLIAVDCEMVLTVNGSSLARITLIDEDGSLLLDELVKPDQPILDYLTRFSGITPARMKTATCSLRRAQKHVRKLVNHNVILVGHGLENDLKALQLAHPYCVDTSLLYDHHRGPPYKPSLRFLARSYLERHIQERNHEHIGHDSNEDARATLDLFKLKLANKPSFGKFKKTELIMDRLLANRPSRSSAILESSKSDYRSFGSTESGEYHRVDTDEELVDLTLEKLPTTNFLFTRYQAADENLLRRELEGGEAPSILPSAAKATSDRAIRLQTLDSYVRRVYQGLPPNSFLVISGGIGDVPEYKALYDKRQKYQEKYGGKKSGPIDIPENEKWTKADHKRLCELAAKARTIRVDRLQNAYCHLQHQQQQQKTQTPFWKFMDPFIQTWYSELERVCRTSQTALITLNTQLEEISNTLRFISSPLKNRNRKSLKKAHQFISICLEEWDSPESSGSNDYIKKMESRVQNEFGTHPSQKLRQCFKQVYRFKQNMHMYYYYITSQFDMLWDLGSTAMELEPATEVPLLQVMKSRWQQKYTYQLAPYNTIKEKFHTLLKTSTPVRQDFTCAVCLCIWQEPTTLHCNHTFCRNCIQHIVCGSCYKLRRKTINRISEGLVQWIKPSPAVYCTCQTFDISGQLISMHKEGACPLCRTSFDPADCVVDEELSKFISLHFSKDSQDDVEEDYEHLTRKTKQSSDRNNHTDTARRRSQVNAEKFYSKMQRWSNKWGQQQPNSNSDDEDNEPPPVPHIPLALTQRQVNHDMLVLARRTWLF
ncbi:hypothetical protein [Parasitella parasitica]|uniref:RING-type domain-containing protein n=1 Tax=Parasitella parasitica TaxID=35722 RepID=A0A0B7NGL8_9FUNG|nr:hypothetical protein [Parasitella parasitica]